ncbi:CCA tRNA nucleotidyltransferase [Halobacillus shinanisalinarum]|uniref:CCA-adding enzyme n=1 Tax=Halobacillus shinanisalinarum TaxID=2932258 RepID=A0ABY4GZN6_9BACI|nr:CCA tRNA nucleotidyltransferase [Halobacillus shinanisalinarum]UOQ93559.1 CCA tRNA nucleotidyltransferase [Halobacillus shinanisalinarum]
MNKHKPSLHSAFNLLSCLEEAGYESHIVGGAVRDIVLGRPMGDIDIATSATPQQVMSVFSHVIPIGIDHGTVMVRYQSHSFEVTTYRTEEGYTDFRHPDEVAFVNSIRKDLSRRDFTINAMAMNQNGDVIDPFHGKKDLSKRVIRAVGDAHTRFNEDPLRMMRAIRFASQLQFEVTEEVKQAIYNQASLLNHIAVERIAVEFEKLVAGKGYQNGIHLCDTLGVFSYLPIFSAHRSLQVAVPRQKLFGFAQLITYYREQTPTISLQKWVKDWKLSNRVKREALSLHSALTEYKQHDEMTLWLAYQLPEHLAASFIQVLKALGYPVKKEAFTEVSTLLPIHSIDELAFQARDLIKAFPNLEKGSWISSGIESIEYAVVTKQLNNKYEHIKEWVDQWNPPASN